MTLRLRAVAVAVVILAGAGCGLLSRLPNLWRPPLPPPSPPTFSQYHLTGWEWDRALRVVVLPVLNQSEHTRAGDEVRAAFTSEMQRLGRFEVVAAPPDDKAVLAAVVHRNGRFDEAVMLDVAQSMKADVVVHLAITQYSPYPRPRLGLVIQVVSPQEAKVVASVDGLWDTTDQAIAERVRIYYRQRPRERPPWIRNHVIASDDSFAGELALDSPALFQRFVCREASLTLLGLAVPGVALVSERGQHAFGPDGKPACATCPPSLGVGGASSIVLPPPPTAATVGAVPQATP